MLTNRITPVLAVIGLLLGTAVNCVASESGCHELAPAKPEEHLAYLQPERSRLKPECIQFAMTELGVKHYLPAIKELVKWLDYRIPETPIKERSAVQMHPTWLGNFYPAMNALFLIGKPANSELLAVIASAETDLVREHATETYCTINRSDVPQAIATLVRASHDSELTSARQKLWDSAKWAAMNFCAPDTRNACLHALDAQ